MSKQDSLYQILCEEITNRLEAGITALPTEAVMCRMWGVSRQTLRSVLQRLRQEKFLQSRQGSGHTLTGLMPGRANKIAVLIADDETYVNPLRITQISRFFDRRHYQTEVILTGDDKGAERSALESLLRTPPRGLISFAADTLLPTPNADLYEALTQAGCSIVFPAGVYPNLQHLPKIKTSLPDEQQGGYDLTKYFLDHRHTHIACVLLSGDQQGQERYLGCCRALTQARLPLSDALCVRLGPRELARLRHDHTGDTAGELLLSLPHEVTAVLCQNDELAFLLTRGLQRREVDISQQMILAGFDDSHLRDAGSMMFMSMHRYPLRESEAACACLYAMLRSLPAPAQDVWTPAD